MHDLGVFEDMKYGSKLTILLDVMVSKDGAEENTHVIIVVNNRQMRKEETSLPIPLVLTGKDREVKLHGLVDTTTTNQFI